MIICFLVFVFVTSVIQCSSFVFLHIKSKSDKQILTTAIKDSYAEISKDISVDEHGAISKLLKLCSAHFTSQALHSFVQLGIADIIGENELTLREISIKISANTNEDALLRILRLLTTVDVLENKYVDDEFVFSLADAGLLLQQNKGSSSMACCVSHWMEDSLWNVGQHLPQYIRGDPHTVGKDPFTLTNGIKSDFYYNTKDHPESLRFANDFVKLISEYEIRAVVDCGLDWSLYNDKIILDIGGFNGKLLQSIQTRYSKLICKSLDLPNVIEKIDKKPQGVELVSGDIFDPISIPFSNVIILKHFLDKCMWNDDQTNKIIKNCYDILPDDGELIIVDAVIPDPGESGKSLQLSLDMMYMLVGRENQRRSSEWQSLAMNAKFTLSHIFDTHIPSCSVIVLTKTRT